MSSLSKIMPKKRQRVMDLVNAAGVNVDDWSNYKGGSSKAAANPKYCYEWAFVEPGKVVVLNLWHESLFERGGKAVREFNMRKSAENAEKSIWCMRALRMDKAIQQAKEDELPIRVIVCSGSRRGLDHPKNEASKVEKRLLDPTPWTIAAYDWNTGECTLMQT